MPILRASEASNGKDKNLRGMVERIVGEAIPHLLGEGRLGGKKGIKPVVVHGDVCIYIYSLSFLPSSSSSLLLPPCSLIILIIIRTYQPTTSPFLLSNTKQLWSGNRGQGTILGRQQSEVAAAAVVEDVIFDPSACYAHSEYELGIMRMFGGFGDSFMREYHRLCPKTEPVEEYEDRVRLYEL